MNNWFTYLFGVVEFNTVILSFVYCSFFTLNGRIVWPNIKVCSWVYEWFKKTFECSSLRIYENNQTMFLILIVKWRIIISIFKNKRKRNILRETQGILLKNENGQLLISKETIDNVVKNTVAGFENVKECNTKIEKLFWINENMNGRGLLVMLKNKCPCMWYINKK